MKPIQAKTVIGTLAATSIVAGGAAPFAVAAPAAASDAVVESEAAALLSSAMDSFEHVDAAVGEFAFDQHSITVNDRIRDVFRKAVSGLCGSAPQEAVDPLAWEVSVLGDVDEAFTDSMGDLVAESNVGQVMTCTCGGNPADGGAVVTAEVSGVPVAHLLDRSQAQPGANTITFVSSDGTRLSLPLSYVIGHHGVISCEVNGESLSQSVGGSNQLWMTRTPANVFIRDIVKVEITEEDAVPDAPRGDELPNSPNAGITGVEIE